MDFRFQKWKAKQLKNESRFQRLNGFWVAEPRALPWADMSDAFGVQKGSARTSGGTSRCAMYRVFCPKPRAVAAAAEIRQVRDKVRDKVEDEMKPKLRDKVLDKVEDEVARGARLSY
ncbi:MAG: hypothetical protein C5B50_12205 [Verrucomicrobia bacterium]|nr:MAG: hypothetical protein C5B50_12205 [Verrucomicrobiota bacterium]